MKKVIVMLLVLALGLTTEVAKADFTFDTPKNLGLTINTPSADFAPNISADGLKLFFSSTRPGGSGLSDIWVTTRATKEDDWGNPVNLGPTVNSSAWEVGPCVSADGLEFYFGSLNRPGGSGDYDLWVTTRETTNDDWGNPVNLGPTINSSAGEWGQSLSADDLELYFSSQRPGGHGRLDLWVTTRETTNDDWGPPVNLGPTVNSSADDAFPYISPDGLKLFFSDYLFGTSRPGGYGGADIWMTTRATKNDPWVEPVNLGPTINSSFDEDSPNISADGSTLYFDFARPGGDYGDIYQASIIPIFDFNGDFKVDIEDLIIMIESWGIDDSICDIGPMPWGDGVVDREDLEVLMSHWGQEILPVELVAYWKLDESEGNIAYDSVGENDGTLYGEPLWQPEGSIVDGAIELDGIDDYISTPFISNPAEGPFSVFAWVKGGAPGQVIISQADGANWLSADPSEGKLMTGLSRPVGLRFPAQPIVSEFVITDGDWHRVGLVWDLSNRTLYVDDVEVASDTQDRLARWPDGLYIGAGKQLEPGSFWSGLIDDVRIYSTALRTGSTTEP